MPVRPSLADTLAQETANDAEAARAAAVTASSEATAAKNAINAKATGATILQTIRGNCSFDVTNQTDSTATITTVNVAKSQLRVNGNNSWRVVQTGTPVPGFTGGLFISNSTTLTMTLAGGIPTSITGTARFVYEITEWS